MSEATPAPIQTPPELPAAPRPLTPQAKSRSWREPTVRFFWLASIALIFATVFLLVSRYIEWRRESRLFDAGRKVAARVFASDTDRTGLMLRTGDPVRVKLTLPDGKEHVASGYLDEPGRRYSDGDSIDIYVDPADPNRWTNRVEASGVWTRFIGAYIAALAALAALLMSIIARNRYLTVWRDGVLRESVVASHDQYALAPQSVRMRCHVTKGRDVLVIRVDVPQACNLPAVGQKMQLLCHPENWHQAVPLITYWHA